MRYIFVLFIFFMPLCMADVIKEIKSCELKQGEEVHLLTFNAINGDTLYLRFRNIIIGAFIDYPADSHDFTGDVVYSKCINNSLIFGIEYGSPYIKGCLITGWENGQKGRNEPNGFCFAEKHIPKSIWFGSDNVLVVIENARDDAVKDTKYIIYDSGKASGERSIHQDELPSRNGYKVFNLK